MDSSLFAIDVIGGFADEFSLVVISNVFDNKFLSVSPYQHFLGGIHLKPCVLRWRVTFGFACQHCFVVELCSYNFGGANRQYTRWVYKGNKKTIRIRVLYFKQCQIFTLLSTLKALLSLWIKVSAKCTMYNCKIGWLNCHEIDLD